MLGASELRSTSLYTAVLFLRIPYQVVGRWPRRADVFWEDRPARIL